MSIECLQTALDNEDLPQARAELKHVKRERDLLHEQLNALSRLLKTEAGESLIAAVHRARQETHNAALEEAAEKAMGIGKQGHYSAVWARACRDVAAAIRAMKVTP